MFGLPDDFTGEMFVGRELQHVDVCSNQLMFSFDGECQIALRASYAVTRPGQLSKLALITAPTFDASLMNLLDSKVSAVRPSSDGTCAFAFENGHTLWVYDDAGPYESYVLGWSTGGLYV